MSAHSAAPVVPYAEAPTLKLTGWAALWILVITAVIFGGTLGLLFAQDEPHQLAFPALAIALILHSLLVLLVLLHLIRRSRTSLRAVGFVRPSWRLLHLLWQIPAVIVLVLTAQLVTSALTNGANSDAGGSVKALAVGLNPVLVVLAFIAIAVLTPVWEEIFFRGLLFGSVRARWGVVLAVVVSTVVFAAVHGVLILLPYLVTLGLSLALLRIFHRSIWGSLVLHVTINCIASGTILTVLV